MITKKGRNKMRKSVIFFASVMSALPAWAQDEAAQKAAEAAADKAAQVANSLQHGGYYAMAAGLAIGVAALGGALGQGRIGATAMDGIARNPQAAKAMFVPMIVGLALIESLVIYALVIAFMITGKI
jgi:F-type H+-transporting ATPase subunit c